ncbi:MAG: hydrogenase nickel incorporation protein HypB [Flavimaricola sp.]|nr:hydrogenase nickel incorporation protein HypB [Flavimaricola sp.]
MCTECGCPFPPGMVKITTAAQKAVNLVAPPHTLELHTSLMRANVETAAHNRAHFAWADVLVINLMSAPGSGKTSLLEATIEALGNRVRIGVIEGDLETENDAARIRAKGVPAVQITTGQACHLDATMIHGALHQLDLSQIDLLFIENVGNLVCPAGFDLGQDANVVLLSVTEGDDKPSKYPVMFRAADLVLLTKADLAPHMDDFSLDRATSNIRRLANDAPVHAVSARRPNSLTQGLTPGLTPWLDWLEGELDRRSFPMEDTP